MTNEKMRAEFEGNQARASLSFARVPDEQRYPSSRTQWAFDIWQAATLKANQWRPIANALEGEHCVCCWLDKYDGDMRHNFDWLEDGVWQNYFNEHEHLLIAGAASGRSEDAPYTHFMPLPLPPTGTGGNHG